MSGELRNIIDERSLKVFHREISITRDLIHPNIVRFYTSFSKRGKPYLVTEYLPGGNAEEMVLNQKGPPSLDVLMGLAGLKKVKHPFAIVLEDDPISILERKPDLPRSLAAVIDRCLKKKPEERFKDGKELKEAIRNLF